MEEKNLYDEVTVNEHIESKKVQEMYEDAKKYARKYVLYAFLSFLIGTTMATIFTLCGSFIIGLITFFIGIIFIVVFAEKYKEYLAPYQKVYEIALKNDAIRYDEKIRFLERKRLEIAYNNDNSIENLKESIKAMPLTLEKRIPPRPPVIKKD